MITFKFNRNGKGVLINCSHFPRGKSISVLGSYSYNEEKERIEFHNMMTDSFYYDHEARKWIMLDDFDDESTTYLECISILIT